MLNHAAGIVSVNDRNLDALRTLYMGSDDAMIIIDIDGNILDANPSFIRQASRYQGDGIVSNIYALVRSHPGLNQLFDTLRNLVDSAVQARKPVTFEEVQEDEVMRITIYPVVTSDLKPAKFLMVKQDITPQKANEERINKLNAQLDFILDKCYIGAWSMDLPSMKIDGSLEHSRIFGYKEKKTDWNFMQFLEHIAPEDRVFVETFAHRAITQNNNWDEAYRIQRSDGAIRWIRDIGSAELDADGKPFRLLGVLMDITDIKQAELDHEALQAQLQQSQKMELVGQLAGGIAHDFNNILTAIQGNTDLILKDTPPTNPHYQKLVSITHSVNRTEEMVRQLLAFARKQPISPRNIELDSELDKMYLLLRRLVREEISLRWQLNCPHCFVKLDPANLVQIVTNLCVNARDAIKGYGCITLNSSIVNADTCDELQRVSCNPTGGYVRIRITDTGSGIDPDAFPHIFEPFFSTKPGSTGTGLGLSMVYGLVKQNNGHVACQTALGKGTTFDLFFPIAHDSIPSVDAPDQTMKPDISDRITVLVVEDEPDIVKIITVSLEEEGFVVLTADSAEQALEIDQARMNEIKLTISDIILPGMNGVEMSKALRQRNPEMKFLFISGYSAETLDKYGKFSTETNFMSKPFSLIRFLNMVQIVLKGT
jgi:PAS domain S-box-containing protein